MGTQRVAVRGDARGFGPGLSQGRAGQGRAGLLQLPLPASHRPFPACARHRGPCCPSARQFLGTAHSISSDASARPCTRSPPSAGDTRGREVEADGGSAFPSMLRPHLEGTDADQTRPARDMGRSLQAAAIAGTSERGQRTTRRPTPTPAALPSSVRSPSPGPGSEAAPPGTAPRPARHRPPTAHARSRGLLLARFAPPRTGEKGLNNASLSVSA